MSLNEAKSDQNVQLVLMPEVDNYIALAGICSALNTKSIDENDWHLKLHVGEFQDTVDLWASDGSLCIAKIVNSDPTEF